MKHIGTDTLPASITCESSTACGATCEPGDELVEAALCSDCDRCRAVVHIVPVGGRDGCEVREPLSYEPEPMKDIETLEEIVRRRDGQ